MTFTRAQIRQMAEARIPKARTGVVVELSVAMTGQMGGDPVVATEMRDESQLARDMRGPEIHTVVVSRRLEGLGSFSPDREVVLKQPKTRARARRDDGRRYLGSLVASDYNAQLGCWVLGRRRP